MMEAQRTEIKQSLVDIQRTSANDMSTLRTQMATLKQFMTDFQTLSGNDNLKIQIEIADIQRTTRNEIATLRAQMCTLKQFMTDSQKTFLSGLHDRVDFLEKVIKYQHMMIQYQPNGKFYEEKNHVTGKIMARMWELGCITHNKGNNIGEYLNGHGGPEDDWLTWTTHATEEDLLDFITAMYATYTAPTVACLIFTFPIVKVTLQVYTTGEYNQDYRKCMSTLKKNTDQWFAGWPSNMKNLPGKCKTFAEAYFIRVENVLTKLHEKKLLK